MSEPKGARKPVGLVVGTRPEAIKMAPVYTAIADSQTLRPVLISTGQHREMLDQALAHFGLVPDVNLSLMRPGQDLAGLTARIIDSMGRWFADNPLAAVLVQGDTTTVFGAALAAFYAGIPVGHVEAGLRTGNLMAPWPEELNRRLVAPMTRWHFAATESGFRNLRTEGIGAETIHVVGNTVVDSLLWTRERIRSGIPTGMEPTIEVWVSEREELREDWVLVTGHRRESFGAGFDRICKALITLLEARPQLHLLFPIHLNPKVRGPVRELLGNHRRIRLCEPVGYAAFVRLMDAAALIISDSGGVQEEAPSLGKHVLVTRETTERPEGVAAGCSTLVGTNPDRIVEEALEILGRIDRGGLQFTNPYGDGVTGPRIRGILEQSLGNLGGRVT